jgi:hypothetical protein
MSKVQFVVSCDAGFSQFSFSVVNFIGCSIGFQPVLQKLSKSKACQHRVQADVLPRSVSRHFSARKTFSVSSVGSRGNTQLTQTVRRFA